MATYFRRYGLVLGVMALFVADIPAQSRPERTDLFGDPLPEGALVRFGTIRFRHGNGTSLAFGADGKTILSAGLDRCIRTWDAVSGQLLQEQLLPPGPYLIVAVLSPNGQLLAFQDENSDNTIYLWDLAKNALRHKWALGERGEPRAMFSPDNKTLVTAGRSSVVRAWDVALGQERVLGRHKVQLHRLSFAADGTLMTASPDGTVYLWDLVKGKERSQLKCSPILQGAALSPSGRIIALWNRSNPDTEVEFRDIATSKPFSGWTAPKANRVQNVVFSSDEKTVLVAKDQEILVWDPLAGKLLHTLRTGGRNNLAISPDGKTLVDLGPQPKTTHLIGTALRVWDLTTGLPRLPNDGKQAHLGNLDAVAISPDKATVATASSEERTVRLWDTATGRLLRTWQTEKGIPHDGLAFSQDGKSLFVGTIFAIVRYDVATGRENKRYLVRDAEKSENQALLKMHLSEDGQTLVAAIQTFERNTSGHGLLTWNVATSQRLSSAALPNDGDVAYSRFYLDGKLVAAPPDSIFETSTGRLLVRFPIEGRGPFARMAFSEEAVYVASGQMSAVQVWELATQKPVCRLEAGEVAHIAFLPAGRRLLALGPRDIQLWDLATAKQIARQRVPWRFHGLYGPSFASSFALSADGKMLVTGHIDTTAILWDFPPALPKAASVALSKEELESCWADLAGNDAGQALRACARLVDVPDQAVAHLRTRLRPMEAPKEEELRRLIAELDSDRFATRQAAGKRLSELAELAEPALRAALANRPSLESRQRLESLLSADRPALKPDYLRHLRAVRALEQMGTPEARSILAELAKGAAGACLTQSARAALSRLERSALSKP